MTDLVVLGGLATHVLVHEVPLAILGVVAFCKYCRRRWCKGHDTDGA